MMNIQNMLHQPLLLILQWNKTGIFNETKEPSDEIRHKVLFYKLILIEIDIPQNLGDELDT